MKQSKNNSKFLLNLVTILTNQKMHDRSMMCDRFLSCIGKATLTSVRTLSVDLQGVVQPVTETSWHRNTCRCTTYEIKLQIYDETSVLFEWGLAVHTQRWGKCCLLNRKGVCTLVYYWTGICLSNKYSNFGVTCRDPFVRSSNRVYQ